jgi:hypothetical protein
MQNVQEKVAKLPHGTFGFILSFNRLEFMGSARETLGWRPNTAVSSSTSKLAFIGTRDEVQQRLNRGLLRGVTDVEAVNSSDRLALMGAVGKIVWDNGHSPAFN